MRACAMVGETRRTVCAVAVRCGAQPAGRHGRADTPAAARGRARRGCGMRVGGFAARALLERRWRVGAWSCVYVCVRESMNARVAREGEIVHG